MVATRSNYSPSNGFSIQNLSQICAMERSKSHHEVIIWISLVTRKIVNCVEIWTTMFMACLTNVLISRILFDKRVNEIKLVSHENICEYSFYGILIRKSGTWDGATLKTYCSLIYLDLLCSEVWHLLKWVHSYEHRANVCLVE